jgi:hypothetical protein
MADIFKKFSLNGVRGARERRARSTASGGMVALAGAQSVSRRFIEKARREIPFVESLTQGLRRYGMNPARSLIGSSISTNQITF